jgi:rhomboid protease GluP
VSARRPENGDLRHAIYAGPEALAGAPVTKAIVWVCVALFAAELLASVRFGRLDYLLLFDIPDAIRRLFGANQATLTLYAGHWDTLLTACFLHAGILHLVLNMYVLRQVGPLVEEQVGSARYAVMYVLTGIAGNLASAFNVELRGLTSSGTVGASGAICGVMGAAVIVALRMEGLRSLIAWTISTWLVIVLAYGARADHIDNAAHVGGLISGALIAIAWRRGAEETTLKRVVLVGGAAALCLAAGAVTLFRATNPAALLTPRERTEVVQHSLERGDCEGARRALRDVETFPLSDAGLLGLQRAVDVRCPRRPALP